MAMYSFLAAYRFKPVGSHLALFCIHHVNRANSLNGFQLYLLGREHHAVTQSTLLETSRIYPSIPVVSLAASPTVEKKH